MIVVIGQPVLAHIDGEPTGVGPSARIALAAAARGATVQLVGKVGEDADGDALVLALSRHGVGHVAILRDAAHVTPVSSVDEDAGEALPGEVPPDDGPTLDAADVELALRYLTEFRVVVLADDVEPDVVGVVTEATGWSGATLVALVQAGRSEPAGLPSDAIVLGTPADASAEAFDRLVGELAAALEAGADPKDAFRELVAVGWEPATT